MIVVRTCLGFRLRLHICHIPARLRRSMILSTLGLPFPHGFVFGFQHENFPGGSPILGFHTNKGGRKRHKQTHHGRCYRGFEDIKLIKDAGLNSYRFSISWSRILSKGSLSSGINQEGMDHYNSFIDELIKNGEKAGITPFVTIYHFDMPLALEEKYGGLLNRSFVDYSELLFKIFGERVKHWFTINEPNVLAQYGYEIGISPPGRCSLPSTLCALRSPVKCFETVCPCKFGGNSSTEPYLAAHNMILAHATVAKLYREKYQEQQKGEVGIVLVSQYFLPYTESEEDKAAAGRLFDFYLGWFMGPLVFGDYPQSMRERVKERLPTFSAEEKVLLNGSLGFVGINYYTSSYAKHKAPPPGEALHYSFDTWAETIGKCVVNFFLTVQTDGHWPEGLQKLLEYVEDKYQNPKVYISENGISDHKDNGSPLEVLLEDPYRISFVTRHLFRINKAIKNGVNVKGYIYWALFDDFEWGMGFERCGIYFVDFNNYTRHPKRLGEMNACTSQEASDIMIMYLSLKMFSWHAIKK
ncbi:beta-glucosidase 13-like [Pyrus ussuriensis x Pyrus communis]|uniref:Beta-glucosidase 13-like n=1 Tax=Pyrus ussuriensis x Pyrus communis TaxID=2448454 RepID=A0A5N5HZ33_9ROSA|nr:beta-glucosidase 13-like [Pyrus ussuriensis x Pyrus communis]